jgi:hypothetical protein
LRYEIVLKQFQTTTHEQPIVDGTGLMSALADAKQHKA